MAQRAREGSGTRQKPKSITWEPMSLLATRHFHKFTQFPAGTMDLKKLKTWNF
jgi:hypothetical protein